MLPLTLSAASAYWLVWTILSSPTPGEIGPISGDGFQLVTNEAVEAAPFFSSVVADATSHDEVVIAAIASTGPETRSFALSRIESGGHLTHSTFSDQEGIVPFRLQAIKALDDGSAIFAASFATRYPKLLRLERNGRMVSSVPLGTEAEPLVIHKFIAGPMGTVIALGSQLAHPALASISREGQVRWIKACDLGTSQVFVDGVIVSSGEMVLVANRGLDRLRSTGEAIQLVRVNGAGEVVEQRPPVQGRLGAIARVGSTIGLVLDRSVGQEREFWFATLGADLGLQFQLPVGHGLPSFARAAIVATPAETFVVAVATGSAVRMIELHGDRAVRDVTIPLALASGDVWLDAIADQFVMIVRTAKETPPAKKIVESLRVLTLRRSGP